LNIRQSTPSLCLPDLEFELEAQLILRTNDGSRQTEPLSLERVDEFATHAPVMDGVSLHHYGAALMKVVGQRWRPRLGRLDL